jgi:hypothetical protein
MINGMAIMEEGLITKDMHKRGAIMNDTFVCVLWNKRHFVSGIKRTTVKNDIVAMIASHFHSKPQPMVV